MQLRTNSLKREIYKQKQKHVTEGSNEEPLNKLV